MSDNSGTSEQKKDIWGNEYTQRYDSDGNKSGTTTREKDIWGNEYDQHYDAEGNKTGTTTYEKSIWGGEYDQHHNTYGDKTGATTSEKDIWGNEYYQHRNSDGDKTGTTTNEKDIWGNEYMQHRGSGGRYSSNANRYQSKYTPPSSSDSTTAVLMLVKWLLIAGIVLAIVMFIVQIVIPLLLINTALIGLVMSYIIKKRRTLFLYIAALGVVYITLDYANGWLIDMLASNFNIFNLLRFLFYVNVAAGLMAIYQLMTSYLNKNRKPDTVLKRNIVGVAANSLKTDICARPEEESAPFNYKHKHQEEEENTYQNVPLADTQTTSRKGKKTVIGALIVILVISTGGYGYKIYTSSKIEPVAVSKHYYYKTINETFIREYPSYKAKQLRKLYKGTEIEVLGTNNKQWYRIKYIGTIGYVPVTELRFSQTK